MKKILLLTVAFISLVTVTSCSKDDENASLQGKWEYSKEGIASGGQEVLEDYSHQSGCAKDYSMITATTIMDHVFNGTACTEEIANTPYTRNGNTITTTFGGETFTAVIKSLTSTTLKVYFTDPDSPTVSEVTVFKRVN